jgi:hypothetical protein
MPRHVVLPFLLAGCGSSPSTTPEVPDATIPADAGVDTGQGASDGGEDVSPRGARVLGLDINTPEDGGYIGALLMAQEAGVQATNVTIDWSDIDDVGDGGADGGDASITRFNPYLHIANLVFPQYSVSVSLAVRAVDTGGPHFPADLTGRALDDPEVIARFNATQDYVFGEIPDLSLQMYVVGNEVDLALGQDATKWAAFTTFFEAAATHARSLRAGVRVGVVFTWRGATSNVDPIAKIVPLSDFIGITYYPLNPDFTVRPVSDVSGDFDTLVRLYPSKPIFVREAGYPSGALVGSSPEKQAEFVHELFHVWDAEQSRIPLMTFFEMTDYPPQVVDDLARAYGISDPNFKDYLGTLGFRTFPGIGADKPAWGALTQGARARGWAR